jgi:integrase
MPQHMPLEVSRNPLWFARILSGINLPLQPSNEEASSIAIRQTGAKSVLFQHVTRNLVLAVETRSTTNYKAILATPQQTLAILQRLQEILHRILVLTCAATALCSSELLALRWANVLWNQEKIAVAKRWSRGREGPTKTRKSEGHVPLHPRSCGIPQ